MTSAAAAFTIILGEAAIFIKTSEEIVQSFQDIQYHNIWAIHSNSAPEDASLNPSFIGK